MAHSHFRILLILVFVCLSTTGFAQHDTDMAVYRTVNYSIEYPKDWELDTSGAMSRDFYIYSESDAEGDEYRESINLRMQDLSGRGIDLERYAAMTEDIFKQNAGSNGQLLESGIVQGPKGKYYRISYIMIQGFKLKVLSYCYIKKDKAYLLTFTAEADKYDSFKETALQVMNSFTVN